MRQLLPYRAPSSSSANSAEHVREGPSELASLPYWAGNPPHSDLGVIKHLCLYNLGEKLSPLPKFSNTGLKPTAEATVMIGFLESLPVSWGPGSPCWNCHVQSHHTPNSSHRNEKGLWLFCGKFKHLKSPGKAKTICGLQHMF